MPPVPYTDALARNLRAARAIADIGQADVAARMNELGYPEWRRQTVARVEKGTRRITAEEAAALTVSLGIVLSDITMPRDGGEEPQIMFPSGLVIDGRRLLVNDGSVTWDENNKPVLSPPSGPDTARLAAEGAEKLRQRLIRDGWTPPSPAVQPGAAAESHDDHGTGPERLGEAS